MKITWVLVSCNTDKEANIIGSKALEKRLTACFDVLPRTTNYFWPPKSGEVESAEGYLLILNTLPKFIKDIEKLIKKHHCDDVPFFGSLEICNVNSDYARWLKDELGT